MLVTKEIINKLDTMYVEYGSDDHCIHKGGMLWQYALDVRNAIRRIEKRIEYFDKISVKGFIKILEEESCADWIPNTILSYLEI